MKILKQILKQILLKMSTNSSDVKYHAHAPKHELAWWLLQNKNIKIGFKTIYYWTKLIEIKWVTFLEGANLLIHVWLLLYSIQTTVLKVFIAPISPVLILYFYRVLVFSFKLLCYSMHGTFPLISMCSYSNSSVLTHSTNIFMSANNV